MKLLILVVAVALSNAAKLDKTYLPPRSAQTAGGSGNFLQTPVSGLSGELQENGFSQRGNRFPQRENGFSQRGNGFPQRVNGFSQRGNGFSQPENGYSNDNGFSRSGNNDYNNGLNSFEGRPERAQAAFERNAAILRQDNQNDGETYAYAYETENGIYAEESGVATNGVEAQGGFSYTGDDGQVYSIRYTADQNGFVPQGDHLPTPPPVPEEILQALEQNARDEAAGIYDDGSYNEAKYGSGDEFNTNSNYNNNAYNNRFPVDQGDDDTVVTNSAFRNSPRPGFRNQGFNQGDSSQGDFDGANNGGSNRGVNKAYLPPFANRRGSSTRSRQQPFSARNGYKY